MDAAAGATGGRGIALTDRQRLAWLRLIRSDHVGPATFRDLINHFGTAEAALENLPELARRGGAAGRIRIMPADAAEREMEAAARFGARFIGIGEADYPPLLRSIDGPPPLIAVKGDSSVVLRPGVAIVGSRNASVAGMKFAARLAREIAGAGYTIVSGLARGIDAAAHRASLETGTIAAMAGGLDRPYPPENLGLYGEICNGAGLALSEMPFGWEPRARDFPRRNRLIAGIGHGLVVVEAAARSGSLISARRAADFGRLVFAVPGSPLDPRSSGTNALIKDGAILTTEARDVIDALAPSAGMRSAPGPLFMREEEPGIHPPSPPPGADERVTVISALGQTPVDVDDIIRHTGLAAPSVHLILLELDLAGRLRREVGGAVALVAPDF